MANSKCLIIASSEAYTGKSATILGIAHQLQKKGIDLGYGKPLGTSYKPDGKIQDEQDLQFVTQTLNLPANKTQAPLVLLDEKTILNSLDKDPNCEKKLVEYADSIEADLILIEGGGNLSQGNLFHLCVPDMAETLDASVLLVVKYHSLLVIGQILHAQKLLGDRLKGVLINNVPTDAVDTIENTLKPFMKTRGIDILGIMPNDRLLQSVSVRELVAQLKADVLCREDRLDLMVETLTVGAMNVNSALEYFRKGKNMAVITGSDRTDLQLAALESSTNCLILTGHSPPQELILARAKDLEIPILSVNLDTLTTVEIVDQAFGTVRLHEAIKVQCVQSLIEEHFDLDKLLSKIGM